MSRRRASRAPNGRLLAVLVALALLVATVRPVGAGVVEETAAAAAFDHAQQNQAELARLASWTSGFTEMGSLYDVWVIADEVLARHSHEAAVALAKAAPLEHDPVALVAYLDGRRKAAVDLADRDALGRLEKAIDDHAKGDPLTTIEAELRALKIAPGTVLHVRREIAVSRVSAWGSRWEPAVGPLLPLVDEAKRLGWTWAAREIGRRTVYYAVRADDYDTAIRRFDRTIRELPAKTTPTGVRAHFLGEYAAIAIEAGQYELARRTFEAALAAFSPEQARQRLVARANIAELDLRERRYADSLAGIRVARRGLEGLGEGARGDLAFAITVEARLRAWTGRLEEAVVLYRQAWEIHRLLLGTEERIGEGVCAANLGDTLGRLGLHVEAERWENEALRIFQQVVPNELRCARILGLRGERLLHRGDQVRESDPSRAAESSEAALRAYAAEELMARRLRVRDTIVGALVGKAECALDLGKVADAAEPLKEALDLAQLEEEPLLLAEVHGVRARAARLGKDPDRAIAEARRGAAELRKAIRDFTNDLDLRVRETRMDLYEEGALAAAQSDRAEDLLFFLEDARATGLITALGGGKSVASLGIDPTLRAEREAAAAAEAKAERALDDTRAATPAGVRSEAMAPLDRAYADAKRLRAEVEGRIRTRGQALDSRSKVTAVTLPALQKRLAEVGGRGTALVLYGIFDTEAWALLVRPEEARIVRLPGTSGALCTACGDLLEDTDPEAFTKNTDAVRDLLVKPLDLGAETKRLLVAPDGAIATVPWRAILPEGMSVVLVPSAAVWTRLQEEASRRGTGVIAIGGCEYDRRYAEDALDVHGPPPAADGATPGAPPTPDVAPRPSPSESGAPAPGSTPVVLARRSGLRPLPASAGEAKAIGTDVLLGRDATLARVRSRLSQTLQSRVRAIHFACHGLLDNEYPSLCALALTATEKDDGLLKVHELLGLDLSTDLVTLSACDTARGRDIRGEGLMSVARAFLAAGAPRVVASLWKVEDEASSAFMIRFHEHYRAGRSASEALRRTQAEMRKGEVKAPDGTLPASFREPKAWAAWVLWGVAE